VQRRGRRTAIDRADPDQDIVGPGLRVFDEHVEVAVVVEHAGVDELISGSLRVRRRFSATRSAYG
jgi:hypothetical protein